MNYAYVPVFSLLKSGTLAARDYFPVLCPLVGVIFGFYTSCSLHTREKWIPVSLGIYFNMLT